MGCHQHTNVHDEKRTRGSARQGASTATSSAGQDRDQRHDTADRATTGRTSTLPAGQAAQGRAVRASATPADKDEQETFDTIRPSAARPQCHEDSLHKGSLGEKCSRCHSPGMWDALKFDHDEPFPDDTKGSEGFPLKGEHKNNDCEACHPKRAVRRHADDVRRRRLPRQRRRAQGPARQPVREVPPRDRRQHLQPQHDVALPLDGKHLTCAAPTAIRR